MKFVLALALVASIASAADVTVLGAQSSPMMTDTNVRIASRAILNRPTALLNKNDVATDNNVMIARSNVLKMQNDRLALVRNVEEALDEDPSASTAVLTKNVLRAVSAPSDDAAMMTKASAVVATKDDPSALSRTIASFVDSAMKKTEQSIQSKTPSGVIARIGTTDILRQPTAALNKNTALSDNQITIARSDVMPTQNDQVVLRGAKVATLVAPASALDVGQVQMNEADDNDEELEKKKKKKTSKK